MAITVSAKTRAEVSSGALSLGSYTVATDDVVVFPICANTNFGTAAFVITKSAGTATMAAHVEVLAQQSGGQFSHHYVHITAGGTITFSVTGSPFNDRISCAPLVLTGVDVADIVDVEAQGGSTTNSIDVGATSTVAGCVAVVGGTEWNDLGTPSSSDLTDFAGAAFNGAGGSMSGGSGWETVAAASAFTGNLDASGAGAADWDWGAVAYTPAGGAADPAGLTADPSELVAFFIRNQRQLHLWEGSPGAGEVFVEAPAEHAAGTGEAFDATVQVAASAGHASATGSASNPLANIQPSAGVASATGAASSATVTINPTAGHAAATGAAFAPAASIKPTAGHAAGTGAAFDASATTGGVTNAAAEHAAATGAAFTAQVDIKPSAGHAAGTGAAGAVTAKVSPTAGNSSGTGTAHDASVVTGSFTSANATVAAAAGTAGSPTVKVAPAAGHAAATGAAANPTSSVKPTVGHASATAAAFDASVAIAVSAAAAFATAVAFAITARVAPAAGHASATGEAFDASDIPTVLTELRMLRVRAEDRTYLIAADTRTLTVRLEERTLSVPPTPDRDLTIGDDDRTLLVEALT